MVTNGGTGFAECDHLGVGGGIGRGDVTVPSPADDFAVAYYDCAYGDFFGFESALGATEGFFHPKFVGGIDGGLWSWVSGLRMDRGCFLWAHSRWMLRSVF